MLPIVQPHASDRRLAFERYTLDGQRIALETDAKLHHANFSLWLPGEAAFCAAAGAGMRVMNANAISLRIEGLRSTEHHSEAGLAAINEQTSEDSHFARR